MANKANKKISLRTSDNEFMEVDEAVAMEFKTVKVFFDDNDSDTNNDVIPLPNVDGRELEKIVKYIERHRKLDERAKEDDGVEKELKEFDRALVNDESDENLKRLIAAANYLNVNQFFDFLAKTIADRIKNKSPDFVRKYFGIENDFTPEEEAQVRKEFAWAFEGIDDDR